MGKIDDILHAFLDGETTESQEVTLIHALISRTQLRERFVNSCRIHHATLSAHSPEQAAEFKKRLDLFCQRWEATSHSCVSGFKTAFSAGALTTGIAALFLLGFGLFVFQGSKSPSITAESDGPLMTHEVTSPVRHVTLVNPSRELDGEPLSITFSVAQVTSEEMTALSAPQQSLTSAYPELSDTFSQAYIKLLREEREQVLGIEDGRNEGYQAPLGDPFGFQLSGAQPDSAPAFGTNEPVTFSFESIASE
ncbi:MAG: hypothetical protein AAF212_06165 [Verrucomicrobiota bacterium]